MSSPPPPRPPRFDTVRPGLDEPTDRPARLTPGPQSGYAPPSHALPIRPPFDPDRVPTGRSVRSEEVPRSHPLMKVVLWTTGLVAGVIVIAGVAIAVAPPVAWIKSELIAQVKAKTGRDLTIAGPARLKITSGLALSLDTLALSPPPGQEGAPTLTADAVEARVRLWPLFSRQVSVDSLVLVRPVFNLAVDATGRRSWDVTPRLGTRTPDATAAAKPEALPAGVPDAIKDFVDHASDPANPSPLAKTKRIDELALGDVRVEDATVVYSDARSGQSQTLTHLNAHIDLQSLASPLDANGSVDYLGQAVRFDVKLASPRALMEDRAAKLSVMLDGAPLQARFEGTMTVWAALELEGVVSAKAASLRALAAWLGHELPPADGFGPLAIAGTLRTTATSYALSDAKASLDGAQIAGNVTVEPAPLRPHITANLRVSELDLNRYTLAAGRPIAAAAPTRATNKPSVVEPQSIEDAIKASEGARVKGYVKRAGWSHDPIALGALNSADIDAKLTIGRLLFRDIKVEQSNISVALKNKVLRTTFDDVTLYGGHGRGFISIDATNPAATVGVNLAAEGVAAQAFLKDAANFELVAGTAKVSIALGAQGQSEADLVGSSNGKADITFTDGSLVGYNLAGTLRGLMQGRFDGLKSTPTEKTDFSDMAASFAILNGVATNQDLRMNSPALRVTGAGQFQLAAQTLDYALKPKVVASLQGQGATDALAGLEIPLRLTGPWAQPQITPSINGIIKDPGKAIDAVKDIGKQLKENGGAAKLGNALKGLLGKGQPGEGGDGEKAKQLLDKLFKQ